MYFLLGHPIYINTNYCSICIRWTPLQFPFTFHVSRSLSESSSIILANIVLLLYLRLETVQARRIGGALLSLTSHIFIFHFYVSYLCFFTDSRPSHSRAIFFICCKWGIYRNTLILQDMMSTFYVNSNNYDAPKDRWIFSSFKILYLFSTVLHKKWYNLFETGWQMWPSAGNRGTMLFW